MSEPFRFEVAISFAGDDKRPKVRAVAELLRDELGDGKVFFDEWFEAELAGHDAQVVLQSIYRKSTRLVVTCVCQRYAEKPWTQDEWRAIQAFERSLRDAATSNFRRMRFLPLRIGDGEVDGLFETAIVPDVRDRSPQAIAQLILERLDLASCEGSAVAVTESPSVAAQQETTESVVPVRTRVPRSVRAPRLSRRQWLAAATAVLAGLGIVQLRERSHRHTERQQRLELVVADIADRVGAYALFGRERVARYREFAGFAIDRVAAQARLRQAPEVLAAADKQYEVLQQRCQGAAKDYNSSYLQLIAKPQEELAQVRALVPWGSELPVRLESAQSLVAVAHQFIRDLEQSLTESIIALENMSGGEDVGPRVEAARNQLRRLADGALQQFASVEKEKKQLAEALADSAGLFRWIRAVGC